jgi:hypothetical protein
LLPCLIQGYLSFLPVIEIASKGGSFDWSTSILIFIKHENQNKDTINRLYDLSQREIYNDNKKKVGSKISTFIEHLTTDLLLI